MAADPSGRNAWLGVVRDGYIGAVGQDSYPLLDAWVRASNANFARYTTVGVDRFNCPAYFGTK